MDDDELEQLRRDAELGRQFNGIINWVSGVLLVLLFVGMIVGIISDPATFIGGVALLLIAWGIIWLCGFR